MFIFVSLLLLIAIIIYSIGIYYGNGRTILTAFTLFIVACLLGLIQSAATLTAKSYIEEYGWVEQFGTPVQVEEFNQKFRALQLKQSSTLLGSPTFLKLKPISK